MGFWGVWAVGVRWNLPLWPRLALCESPASLFLPSEACAHHPPTMEWICKGIGGQRGFPKAEGRREGGCVSHAFGPGLPPPTQWQGGSVLNDNFLKVSGLCSFANHCV